MRADEGLLEAFEVPDARRFVILVRRFADSLSYGTDRSPFLGSGIEYVQSRPYQHGDPVRAIDWRVTARAGRVFVKEHESPKRMPVILLLDTSASMTVGSTPVGKYATALTLAGGIALASLERSSPVGVVGVGSRALRVRPSLARTQVLEWLLRLRRFRYDERTCMTERLAELLPSLRQRTLIVVLSDLHEPGAPEALRLAAQRHDCAVLQIQDPAERGLPGAGWVRAREPETGRTLWVRGRGALLDQPHVDATLRRAGIDHLVVRTDRDPLPAVRRFFASRGLIGREAR